ncbi:RagB/SusD family nutrient uptake outer membrane protein [Flagellimonas sp. GZD32]|uniref:RagB/SusD family nutrient uptake outer membrane protein n=1 Tax=Flagellimonas cixiensis TaxID=3228750 RepID=UPI0035C8D1CA
MKIKSILTLIVVSVFLIVSCSDDLDIANPNRISVDEFVANSGQDQAVAITDAIYNALIVDGLYQRMTPVHGDARGDEARSRSPWAFLSQTANFTVPSTDGAVAWCYEGYYVLINRANQALENVPAIEDVDPDLRSRLLGQAYFLRALAYFNATNIYDNVPLVLTVPKSQDEFYPSNQDVTQAMIYEQVEADLTEAIARLPISYNSVAGPDAGQVGRATLGAAQALMGKVKLYQEDYAAAASYFNEVISSGQYALVDDYGSMFSQDPADEAANTERIFWAEFSTEEYPDFNWGGDPTINWRQFSAIAPTYSGADFYDFFPTPFLDQELRAERTINDELDPRYAATILAYDPDEGLTQAYGQDNFFLDPNNLYIAKYTLANYGGDPFFCGINYSILRLADVLLMQAEALANTGDIPGAAALMQQVRDRANLPDREAEFAGYNLTQFMEQLAHERVTELGLEGVRYYDIKRWGWLNDPVKLEELKSHDPEFNTFMPGREYQPFSQTELDRNPNLVGNSANQ